MNNKYTIIWEKWHDPFGVESDESADTPFDGLGDYYNDDDANTGFNETESSIIKKREVKAKVVVMPFGIIPMNEYTSSGKIFNFWNGHTNFAITEQIAEIIEDTDGVEAINVFTKYRFRIAVGKAFIDSEVMRSINTNVYHFLEI